LELLNSLLMSGEVPGLIGPEEIDRIVENPEELKREAIGNASLYDCFCERIKKNLRVVFSLDYQRQSFALYCAANPGLLRNTTVIWQNGFSQ
jgi:dynein heavy chain 2